MNEVERTVRERFAAYQEWVSKANTTAGTLGRKNTTEAFNAFCAGWNARAPRERCGDRVPGTVEYVAGFLIDPTAKTVALVRKGKPEWQRGKLNGVGGKIELEETPREAMQREFWEEAGLNVRSWDHFATVEGPWGRVYFFRAFNEATPRTMESEPIEVHRLEAVPYAECIPNLSWLIPLALYTHDMYAPVVASESDPRGPQPTDGPDYHAEHAAWMTHHPSDREQS